MAKKTKTSNPKDHQISIDEYKILKEKQAKKKIKLQPWQVSIPLIIPFLFFIFMLVMYFAYIRHVPIR